MKVLDAMPDKSRLNGSKTDRPLKDSDGRFAKGNPGGPGRPRRETERAYLEVMRSQVSLEEWAEVVRKALADAKEGDATARAWLSKYLVGDDPLAMLDVLDRLAELEGR